MSICIVSRIHYRALDAQFKLERYFRKRNFNTARMASWATAHERKERLQATLQELLSRANHSLQALDSKVDVTLAAAQSQFNRLEAMLLAFRSVPAFEAMAIQRHQKEYGLLSREVQKLGEPQKLQAPEVSDLLSKAQHKLESLATEVNRDICQLEKEVTLDVVSESLASLGYEVETRGEAIKATRGKNAVWAKADFQGQLEMDMSGFTGKQCLAERKQVEAELASRGLELEVVHSEHHGKPRGGVLAQALEPVFNPFHAIKGDFRVTQKNRQKVRA